MEKSIVKKPSFFSAHKTETIVIGVVVLVVVVAGVLVLLWYLNVIMPRYHCVSGLCVKNEPGKPNPPGSYASSDCNSKCTDCNNKCTDCNSKCTETLTPTRTQTTSASRNVRVKTRANTNYYNQEDCMRALDALPYQKCQFNSSSRLYECMKTVHNPDFTPEDCRNNCHSFECTDSGCTECALSGCTKAEHYFDNACNQKCSKKFQLLDNMGVPVTCEVLTATTAANPFYSLDQCMTGLNALTSKKCIKQTKDNVATFNCVTTTRTDCGSHNDESCFCDSNNCKLFNTTFINTALQFTFPGNFFNASENNGNNNGDIWSHTLLWIGSYTAQTDGALLTVQPQFQLFKPDGNNNGAAVATWLVFTDDYCKSHSTVFPSNSYISSQGSYPPTIADGIWFTNKEKSNYKGNVYNFINGANDNTTAATQNRWGVWPSDFIKFSNWPGILRFTMISGVSVTQDVPVFPTKAGEKYNICMYIGTNTTDSLRVNNVITDGAGSWGTSTESSWYETVTNPITSNSINTAAYFEFPDSFFYASGNHGNENWDIWSHTLLWMGSYTALTDGGTLNVQPQFQLLKPNGHTGGQALATWLVFTDDYCKSNSTVFPSSPYNSSQGHNAVTINKQKWFTDPLTQSCAGGLAYNFIAHANDNTTATTQNRWGYLPDMGNFGNWPGNWKFTMIPGVNLTQDIQVSPTIAGKKYHICMYMGTNTTDVLRVGNVITDSWGSLWETI